MKGRNILMLAGTIFIVLALASCGGGGGGGDTTDTTPPTVVSTVPGSNGTGAAVNSAITATFSEAMDASTISDTTFTLEAVTDRGMDPAALDARSLAGTVAYSASSLTATFTPSADLSYGTWYRATITTGVTDTTGNGLAQNYVWDFQSGLNPDSTAPTVVSTSPEDGDTMVRINALITADFSEDLDPTTVSQSTFYLGSVSSVDGTVSYADRTMTFTPTLELNTGTEYEAMVGWEATDLAGNDAELESWTFTTSHWNIEDKIENTGTPSGLCDVAANDDGYATAAWIRIENEYTVEDHTHYTGKVFASRYVPDNGWTNPVAISSSNDAAEVRVAMDPQGNAIVIWAQTMIDDDYWGYFEQIYAKKYQIAYGWIGETELTTGSDLSVKEPEVAMHTNGYAMMVWNQEEGFEDRKIYCKRYVYSDIELWPDGIGEADPISIHNAEWGYAFKPDVAFDPFGDVMVVWYQYKSIGAPDADDAQSVNAIFHDWDANDWDGPHEIADVVEGTSINQPAITSDTDGDFGVVWTQDDVDDGNEREDVWFSAHQHGDDPDLWQGPDQVSSVSGDWDAEQPRVVLAPTSEDTFVAWYEYPEDHSEFLSKARRYSSSAGDWLSEVDLFPGWDLNSNPEIVMDEAGIVSVIAGGYTGTLAAPILSMLATRYVPGEGWDETEVITGGYDYSEFTRWSLAVDSDGNLHAVCSLATDDDISVYALKYFK